MGAVAKKDLVPYMSHFTIQQGVVTAYNGEMSLSSPIDSKLNCKPKAKPLIDALKLCKDDIDLSLTPTGRLKVSSGKFKSFIDCTTDTFIRPEIEGVKIDVCGEKFMKAIEILEPFIGDDASRPWTNGVLFDKGSCYATCNPILIQYWLGDVWPLKVNIPKFVIRELLRIKEIPTHIYLTNRSITIEFQKGRWLKGQLLSNQWPDLDRILNVRADTSPNVIPDSFYEGLNFLRSSTDDQNRVYLQPGSMSTSIDPDVGSFYECEFISHSGIFSLELLRLLEGVAKTINLDMWPAPCLFFGENLRGAIIGRRQ